MYRDSYSVGSSIFSLSVSSRQYEGGMAACSRCWIPESSAGESAAPACARVPPTFTAWPETVHSSRGERAQDTPATKSAPRRTGGERTFTEYGTFYTSADLRIGASAAGLPLIGTRRISHVVGSSRATHLTFSSTSQSRRRCVRGSPPPPPPRPSCPSAASAAARGAASRTRGAARRGREAA